MRLFLQRCLRTLDQALSDSQAGIAVGMVAHLALWAEAEGGAGSVARLWLSLVVAHDQAMTTMAFPARIARIHTGRDDTACIPRLVLCVAENAALHPVGPFRIAPTRIRALLWSQVGKTARRREYSSRAWWRTGQCGYSPDARSVRQRA